MPVIESFLHRYAKELLYFEIEQKNGFDWKSNKNEGFESLINRPEYRKECVLMEFPSMDGYYPDECACSYIINSYDDHEKKRLDKTLSCNNLKGYRWNNGLGFCCCANCQYLMLKDVVIHDIAIFWKGCVIFAIEIVNKHPPQWKDKIRLSYPVFIVDASNILKRISNSPVFVTEIIR